MKRDQKKHDAKLDKLLQTGSATDIATVQSDLKLAQGWIDTLQQVIQSEENRLGLTGQVKLKEFKDSDYLQLCVNATILWERIVTRLVEHRFEMSKFNRLAHYECMGRCIGHLLHYVYLTEIQSKL